MSTTYNPNMQGAVEGTPIEAIYQKKLSKSQDNPVYYTYPPDNYNGHNGHNGHNGNNGNNNNYNNHNTNPGYDRIYNKPHPHNPTNKHGRDDRDLDGDGDLDVNYIINDKKKKKYNEGDNEGDNEYDTDNIDNLDDNEDNEDNEDNSSYNQVYYRVIIVIINLCYILA